MKFNRDTLTILQNLRTLVAFPLIINSAYRCAKHNKEIGSLSTSQHRAGRAIDIDTRSIRGHKKFVLLSTALQVGFKGIGVYRGFIHLDFRLTQRVLWTDK